MVGGILIIFIYITRIASNEKFKLPKNILIYLLTGSITLLVTILLIDKFYSIAISIKFNSLNQSITILSINLRKFFNYPNTKIIIFLIIYLLITLIAVVKITGKNFGRLRQK